MFFELEKYGSAPCLLLADESPLTYAHVAQACDEIRTVFSKQSESKNLVLVLCENNPEPLVCYLATLRSSNTVMLLSASTDVTLLKHIVELYKPNFLCAPMDHPLAAASQIDHFQYRNYVVSFTGQQQQEIHNDLGLLLSTSGSTGSPKFVRLSYENVNANAASIASYLMLSADDCPITVLPMGYSYGLSVINSHLSVGARISLTDHSIMTKEFWQVFADHQVSSLSGVPYTYDMLRRLRVERRDLSCLQTMTQAGGKLSDELILHFANIADDNGIRFYTMYGQTEATARISYLPPDRLRSKLGSIGIAIPGGTLNIQTDNGDEGEIVYSGPNVMMGYAQDPSDLALGDVMHGVLATGDIGRFDDDGFCYVTGRLKRMIKMFGNRVNLDDIDRHITGLGAEGVSGGEDNTLRVMITDPDDVERVKTSLVSTFRFDHRAVDVFHQSHIPRNESGKILYSEIFGKPGNPQAE